MLYVDERKPSEVDYSIPQGHNYEYTLKFMFKESHNKTQYKALLAVEHARGSTELLA